MAHADLDLNFQHENTVVDLLDVSSSLLPMQGNDKLCSPAASPGPVGHGSPAHDFEHAYYGNSDMDDFPMADETQDYPSPGPRSPLLSDSQSLGGSQAGTNLDYHLIINGNILYLFLRHISS